MKANFKPRGLFVSYAYIKNADKIAYSGIFDRFLDDYIGILSAFIFFCLI